MQLYRNITCWENQRRLQFLESFRTDIVQYFSESIYNWKVEARIEEDGAKEAKVRINKKMQEVRAIVRASGVSPVITYTPPPVIGGYIQKVDLMQNVFNLHQFQIPDDELIGFLDRAIGVYESNRRPAFWRTINPFWWVWRLMTVLVSLPFSLLGVVGFDAEKAEASLVGRLIKFLLYMIIVSASFLSILHFLGLLAGFKKMIGIGD
jgi:hypothetical protein